MAVSEASVVIERTASGRGIMRSVALEMASFTWLMAVIIFVVTVNSFLGLDRESVRGRPCGQGGEGSGGRSYSYRVIFVRPAWTLGVGTA